MDTIDIKKVTGTKFDSLDVFILESTVKTSEYDVLVVVSGLEKFSDTKTSPLHMVTPLDRFEELSLISTQEEHTCQVCGENQCNTSLYSLYGPDTDPSRKLRWDRVHPLNRTEEVWICSDCHTEFQQAVYNEISESTNLVSSII